MIIETLSTGDEVITGFVTDTNVSWLCQRLLDEGIQPSRRQTVGDNIDDITAIIRERSEHADIIIVNGGLGPTSDDNTTEAAARAAGVPLIRHEELVERIKDICRTRGIVMDPSNEKQAMLPEGAEIIPNPSGTACGFRLRIGKALCFFTPGVPSEFRPMVEKQIIPQLRNILKTTATEVRRFFSLGVAEARLGGILSEITWPGSIVLGYRADFPTIELKLIGRDATPEDMAEAERLLYEAVGSFIIARDQFNIPAQIAKLAGSIPLQVLDSGTDGLIISRLAQEMHGLLGHYTRLPSDPEPLIARIKKEKIRTLAISGETQHGFCIIYFNGMRGYLQRLKSRSPREKDRKLIIATVAMDMVRRLLSGERPFGTYENLVRNEQLSFHM